MFYALLKNTRRNWRKKLSKHKVESLRVKILMIVTGNSTFGKMLRCYLLCISLGAILLFLPFSLNEPYSKKVPGFDGTNSYTFFDAFFMSVSAATNTGIVNLNVAETYSAFGKSVILILIQLGGLGLVGVVIVFWNLFKAKRPSDLDVNVTLFNERGGGKIGNTYKTIVVSIIFVIIVEFIFAVIYSFWFYYSPAYQTQRSPDNPYYYVDVECKHVPAYHNTGEAIFWGLFHSVSAINNAGIDIIGANSLAPYRNDENIFLQICFIIQIVFGGIGYPIIYDIYEHITCRLKHKKHQLHLFSKIGLVGYLVVTVVGGCFLFGFEYGLKDSFVNRISVSDDNFNPYGRNVALNKFFAIWFELFSTRSAGFSTFDNNLLSQPGLCTVVILMFIGANPSSTGGGIRTTTFLIMIMSICSRFRKNTRVNIFGRQISIQTILMSYIGTFTIFLLIVIFATVGFAFYGNSKASIFDLFFVCVSAFGTVGLNVVTFNNSSPGEITFLSFTMVLMIIGQLGVSTVLLNPDKLKNETCSFSYPTEDIKT